MSELPAYDGLVQVPWPYQPREPSTYDAEKGNGALQNLRPNPRQEEVQRHSDQQKEEDRMSMPCSNKCYYPPVRNPRPALRASIVEGGRMDYVVPSQGNSGVETMVIDDAWGWSNPEAS